MDSQLVLNPKDGGEAQYTDLDAYTMCEQVELKALGGDEWHSHKYQSPTKTGASLKLQRLYLHSPPFTVGNRPSQLAMVWGVVGYHVNPWKWP